MIPLRLGMNSMDNNLNSPRRNPITPIHAMSCKPKSHSAATLSWQTPIKLLPDSALNDAREDGASTQQQQRFKPFHKEQWYQRFQELLQFHKDHGHSAVPHTYPPNPALANWVKRQRRQYKLLRKEEEEVNSRQNTTTTTTTTVTTERINLLRSVGFVWDAHQVHWWDKLNLLRVYHRQHGHCNVPTNYRDQKLATWVKCQRRQYKLYWEGKSSSMTPERILELEQVGFQWRMIPSTSPHHTGTA
jgi:Helicase associated domain